jgi:hypothetical protein
MDQRARFPTLVSQREIGLWIPPKEAPRSTQGEFQILRGKTRFGTFGQAGSNALEIDQVTWNQVLFT